MKKLLLFLIVVAAFATITFINANDVQAKVFEDPPGCSASSGGYTWECDFETQACCNFEVDGSSYNCNGNLSESRDKT